MAIRIISKGQQASGAFNGGQIIENKPVGFPQDGGFVRPFSNLFYWARAEAVVSSTIGLHPHQGFEIMSFVLEGDIRHFDSSHEEWKPLHEGDVQIIRAGSGIKHAEHLEKGAVIFQIWMDPDLSRTLKQEASYDDYHAADFPVQTKGKNEETVLIGAGSPLTLDTKPLSISRYKVREELALATGPDEIFSVYVINGSGVIGGETVEQDDFVIADESDDLLLEPHDEMDVFVVRLASKLPYRTYAERMAILN